MDHPALSALSGADENPVVKQLQSRRGHLLRLAHHLFLVRAITMQRNEQRRRRPVDGVQIVIDFDLGVESSFHALRSFGAGHLPQAYSRYRTTSDSLSLHSILMKVTMPQSSE